MARTDRVVTSILPRQLQRQTKLLSGKLSELLEEYRKIHAALVRCDELRAATKRHAGHAD